MPKPPRGPLRRARAVLRMREHIRSLNDTFQEETRALAAEMLNAVRENSVEITEVHERPDGVILIEFRQKD